MHLACQHQEQGVCVNFSPNAAHEVRNSEAMRAEFARLGSTAEEQAQSGRNKKKTSEMD